MNFIRDENDRIIGIETKAAKHLTHVVRQLSAGYRAIYVPALPFGDVAETAWYADAVRWASDAGITAGTAAGRFSPNSVCTRAQVVSFLWSAAGKPEPQAAAPFADVPGNAWYAKAVAWAVEQGITAGTSADCFSPMTSCTRAQAAVFLWRFAGSPDNTPASGFSDVRADAWYAKAVNWAADRGITAGTGGNAFSPGRSCTRSQIIMFLFRHAESVTGGDQQ